MHTAIIGYMGMEALASHQEWNGHWTNGQPRNNFNHPRQNHHRFRYGRNVCHRNSDRYEQSHLRERTNEDRYRGSDDSYHRSSPNQLSNGRLITTAVITTNIDLRTIWSRYVFIVYFKLRINYHNFYLFQINNLTTLLQSTRAASNNEPKIQSSIMPYMFPTLPMNAPSLQPFGRFGIFINRFNFLIFSFILVFLRSYNV